MPKTRFRRYIAYTLDELDEKAQEYAMNQIAQEIMETYDPDQLTEQFAEILKEWGFPTDNIEWSLSYRQGDGVAFYGTIDVKQYLKHTKQLRKYRIILGKDPYLYIVRNSWGNHYSHYNTMDVEEDTYNLWDNQKALDKMADLIENVKDNVVKVSRELESIGYAEFDHITSEESIKELIEINEWEFTEDGRIAG